MANTELIKKFNNTNYVFDLELISDGVSVPLNPESVAHLEIEDALTSWPIRGFFIYDTAFDTLEKKLNPRPTNMDAHEKDLYAKMKEYLSRNDGKDFLNIRIYAPSEGFIYDNKIYKNLPKNVWEMTYECVIFDKQDIPSEDMSKKIKKFSFWDKRFQQMVDIKPSWSTATSKSNPSNQKSAGLTGQAAAFAAQGRGGNAVGYIPYLASDEDRKMYTGTAIKSILNDNNLEVDDALFDAGSTKIFFTSPTNYNIWDNINYLLANHLSQEIEGGAIQKKFTSDICIFDIDRYTKKFTLIPISKYFENAGKTEPGEYQTEHLYFEDFGQVGGISVPKAPESKNPEDVERDVKIVRIRNYEFDDMSAFDNIQNIVTTPVHSYINKTKTFLFDIENSNVTNLKQKIIDSYIANKVNASQDAPLITLNKYKTENKIVNHVYSLRSNNKFLERMGLGTMLFDSLFLNQYIHLQLEGATLRQAGKFIAIDRKTSSDNNLDYKLCGQWFAITVKHIFAKNKYTNEVFAVKLHSWKTLPIKEDV